MTLMEDQSGVTRLNIFLAILGAVLLAILLWSNRSTLVETWRLLTTLRWEILALIPLWQVASYFSLGHYYKSFFASFNYKCGFKRLFELVFALNFVNLVLPSGGLSGATYFSYALRGIVPVSTATLGQLARYVLGYLTYFVVVIVAAVFLIVGNDFNTFTLLLIGGLIILSVVGIYLFRSVMRSRQSLNKFIRWIVNFLDKVSNWLRRSKKPLIDSDWLAKTLRDFHKGYDKVIKNRKHLYKPFGYMMISTFFENMIVYTAFLAVGEAINPGIVLLGFAIANAVGVLSVIPGDVGVHELAIITVVSLAGVPAAVAISATLIYRVFNKMIFLPIGFFFYTKLLKRADT